MSETRSRYDLYQVVLQPRVPTWEGSGNETGREGKSQGHGHLTQAMSHAKHVPGLREGATVLLHTSGKASADLALHVIQERKLT